MHKFKRGDEIVTTDGVRGQIVYPFAVPSDDGGGVTVKLMNCKHNVVMHPSKLRKA
jgi:hypothetical protein